MKQRAWRAGAASIAALIAIGTILTGGLAQAQGTGNIWITQINSQSAVIEGYRHNVTVLGDEMALVGTYTRSATTLDLRLRVNGATVSPTWIYWDDGSYYWELNFTVLAPCQKMVLEIDRYTLQAPFHDWTEPIETFSFSDTDNDCLPRPDDCEISGSGGGPGAPVDVVTGRMWYHTVDLALSGPGALRFERTYDNQSPYDGDLGYGWRHTYSHYLDLSVTTQATYYDQRGHKIIYGKNRTGVYDEDWFFGTSLAWNAGGGYYELKTRQKTSYRFNSSGKLTTIIDRKGNTVTIAYDGSNRIATVTDPFGKTLTFAYSGASTKIQSVTTNPDARVISFAYDGSGNLATFTDPASKVWTYEYLDADVHNLTGVIDPLGHYIETHTYYANDKAQTSAKQGGQESLTFTYSPTTATDSLGRVTTYTINMNLRVITQVSGPGCGCGGCPAVC